VLYFDSRAEVETYLRKHGEIENLHLCFVPALPLALWLMQYVRPLGYVAYNLWHRRAFRVAARLHARLHFDLVHQANMCGFREPGYLWRLPAPFIWGPVGGTQNYPRRFLLHAGLGGAIREGARGLVNRLQLILSPRVRRAARQATSMLAANRNAEVDFERWHGVRPIRMLDIAIESVAPPDRIPRTDGPLRMLWSGVFGHHKALQLLLSALAELPPELDYELKILGDGPLARRWRRLARRLGIERHLTWCGWVPHARAMTEYNWADVFVFTSLRDTLGTVVLEALSRGVPVVCLDHQGVGDLITKDCGIKIPVTTPLEVAVGFRDALASLARDRTRLDVLSRGAIERAQECTWERRGERMAAIYKRALLESPQTRGG
jgi:glycosyltransferase involved in cell wall biosynthesis